MLACVFGPDQPDLAAELTRIRDDRVLRARPCRDRLPYLGVDVSSEQVAPSPAGRGSAAHRPRDGDSQRHPYPRGAFTRDWIADGGRACVSRCASTSPRHRLVRAAGGVTVLAHPRAGSEGGGGGGWGVTNEQITRLAAVGLAGLEVFHPDQSDAERARLIALAHDLGLAATGGSDDHGSLTGYRLGCETTSAEAYQDLLSRVPGHPV